jgi:hypothetical protein
MGMAAGLNKLTTYGHVKHNACDEMYGLATMIELHGMSQVTIL